MERLVALTCLFGVLVGADQARALLAAMSTEKMTGIAGISGSLAELFTVLELGAFTCTLIYGVCMVSRAWLARRKAIWNTKSADTITSQ